ncbi:MAG: hypothetical protein IJR68_02815 [Fretibacterium sp.]|nr:hypothetical protein [Fretibacterium sp.]
MPMTEQEKKQRIAELRAELKKLEATPRSDWHAGFEALLRIETYKYGDVVHISTEEEIGEVPPRTDFVILVEDEKVVFDKAIFHIFRKINILEYKNPHDSLNERVLRKVCGYANLYIGMAEHEGERPADEVTVSIFRAVKNPKLFSALERNGNLFKAAPGIYRVKGIVDLPFQIIITSELEGEEYTAYHALKKKADRADIEHLIRIAGEAKEEVIREHYRVLLNLVAEKNPQYIDIWRGEVAMRDVLMEIVQEDVDKRVSTAEAAKERETLVSSIKNVMVNLKLTLEQAMDALSIPQSQRDTYASLV